MSIRQGTQCNTSMSPRGTNMYTHVSFICSDGHSGELGLPLGTSCKSYDTWKSYATQACESRSCRTTITPCEQRDPVTGNYIPCETPTPPQPTVSVTCIPRPTCLDNPPYCQVACPVTGCNFCPPNPSISPQATATPAACLQVMTWGRNQKMVVGEGFEPS